MNEKYLFTSESVTEGHPDKMADQISDAVLDKALQDDPNSRVAIETFLTTGLVVVGGELTTHSYIDIPGTVREVVKNIGYDCSSKGFDYNTCGIISTINKQSPDIAQGVDTGGAGDQGMMFGYACNETFEYMPLPIALAHRVTKKLTELRKSNILPYLRPDGKSQVTVEYLNGKPVGVDSIVISSQHSESVPIEELREDIKKMIISEIIGEVDFNKIFINPTGRFVIGGPMGDTGLTGRKIIVDTYGGYARHGGGAFSGKDPTKVDRSAAYMARYIAKNLVAQGISDKLEIQLSYAIGVAEPVSIFVDTFGTGKMKNSEIVEKIRKNFNLTPKGIIEHLQLRNPIYQKTASYGHFGRNDVPWEELNAIVI